MEENDYTIKEKEWPNVEIKELVEGYRLPIDEDGEWNPKIYKAMVKFCNENPSFIIKDCRPNYFELVKESDEVLIKEKANFIRSIRSQYMAEILNKVERYETQKAAEIKTTDSAETYQNYLLYLQYLRDIPQSKDFPNIEVLSFDEWSNK